jgi:hypothetical protein
MERTYVDLSKLDITDEFDWIKEVFSRNSKTLIDLDNQNQILSEDQRNALSLIANPIENALMNDINHNRPQQSNPIQNLQKKVLKNKTSNCKKNKSKLGLIVDYDITSAEILNRNFSLKSPGIIEAALYSIQLVRRKEYIKKDNTTEMCKENKKSPKKSFGIILPKKYFTSVPIKLLEPLSCHDSKFFVEEYEINYISGLKLPKEEFKKIIRFHATLFSDLYNNKK